MKALGIVEAFDVIEDGGAGLVVRGERLAINQLPFEGAPEAFHGGVVVAIALRLMEAMRPARVRAWR